MTGQWYSETLYPDFRQTFEVTRVLYDGRSGFQGIVIFENPRFGRVLVLDGVVQTTECDEFCYHEMITHVPIVAHGDVRKVLIIGGGDGGVVRLRGRRAEVRRARDRDGPEHGGASEQEGHDGDVEFVHAADARRPPVRPGSALGKASPKAR